MNPMLLVDQEVFIWGATLLTKISLLSSIHQLQSLQSRVSLCSRFQGSRSLECESDFKTG